MWKTIAHRSVMIRNCCQANANHNQHHPSLDPRVVKNPMHWERQQDHIDPLRAPRRRSSNNNLAQVFENDRDALHTSQTYKRRDIRECRDRMTLTCPFYSIYQFGMGKGHKIVECIDEWHIEQSHTIHWNTHLVSLIHNRFDGITMFE